jgi:hypothetical protein
MLHFLMRIYRRHAHEMIVVALGKARRAQDGDQQRALELETAQEILAEVFHARPGEVEKMIQRWLEKRWWVWIGA